MTEQGGALAELRDAIDRRIVAEVEGEFLTGNDLDTQTRLDAALTATEARIERLEQEHAAFVRFVRAADDLRVHGPPFGAPGAHQAAKAEYHAARAALTAEGLA